MATIDLNGPWFFTPDPDQQGIAEEFFQQATFEEIQHEFKQVEVPSCWQTDARLEKYEGWAWYCREFAVPGDQVTSLRDETEAFLHFKAVNYMATVWLNGTQLGSHEGGFLPFRFAVPVNLLRERRNHVAVLVDNIRRPDGVPSEATDWFNWAGIHRDVVLEVVPRARFQDLRVITRVPSRRRAEVEVRFQQTAPFAFQWRVTRAGPNDREAVGESGEGGGEDDVVLASGACAPGDAARVQGFQFEVRHPALWSPEHPALHYLVLETPAGTELARVRFGIREFQVRGYRLYLNRQRLVMRGASLHEELMPHGRTYPVSERRRDVRAMKALGFNALRTAHYTHAEALVAVADEEGLLILEEIPLYWGCAFKNPRTFKLAASMVRDMIKRDVNHPSVVMWSMGNEIPVERPECDQFMRRLMRLARHHDATRLVSYVSMRYWCDTTRRAADVTCINGYFGWYYPTEHQLNWVLEGVYNSNPGRPLIYTEFGAGAKLGHHADEATFLAGRFSEERQAAVIAHHVRTFNAKPYVAGWFIWLYRDFRSHMRLNQYQQGYNRKGLVSEKNEPKLVARMMPRLVTDKYEALRHRHWWAKFCQKLFFPLALAFAFISGAISNVVSRKSANTYYEPRPAE